MQGGKVIVASICSGNVNYTYDFNRESYEQQGRTLRINTYLGYFLRLSIVSPESSLRSLTKSFWSMCFYGNFSILSNFQFHDDQV